jgi:hypothetical protein
MADSNVPYATPEEKYPVVQVTRTSNNNLNYKLYDGQLFFRNDKGEEKLYIGNGNNDATKIEDYPFFQAGDWKSITGAITTKNGNGDYILSTVAVVNALPFVKYDSANRKYCLEKLGDIECDYFKSNKEVIARNISASNLIKAKEYRLLDNLNNFRIYSDEQGIASIKLGNYDKIEFSPARFNFYSDKGTDGKDTSLKTMGGASQPRIFNGVQQTYQNSAGVTKNIIDYVSGDYALFNKSVDGYDTDIFTDDYARANFWKSITMGVFLTWTGNSNGKNTYANSYTHFIPKKIIDEIQDENSTVHSELVPIYYQYKQTPESDIQYLDTVGLGVSSGLMLSTYGGKAASKYVYITPVGVFGHAQNSGDHTGILPLKNSDWVLKYVTVI